MWEFSFYVIKLGNGKYASPARMGDIAQTDIFSAIRFMTYNEALKEKERHYDQICTNNKIMYITGTYDEL